MPLFLLSLFKKVHFYVYAILVGIIITLFTMNQFKDHTIESQAEEITEIEQSKIRLERTLQSQNDRVRALVDESKRLSARVQGNVVILEAMDERGRQVLIEIDEQTVPKECAGSIMWAIQKSMEELKP